MVHTLATYPYVVVRIGCRVCKRAGEYRLARLAEKYGTTVDLDELMKFIAADCPYRPEKRKPRKYEANCAARYVDLTDPNPPPPDAPPAMMRLRVVGGRDAEPAASKQGARTKKPASARAGRASKG